nr:hypothetical protein [Clostridium septicum]
MSFSKEELIKILAKDPNIKTAEDIQNVLKDLFGGMLQQMLEAELDNHLGYEKHDYQNKTQLIAVMARAENYEIQSWLLRLRCSKR